MKSFEHLVASKTWHMYPEWGLQQFASHAYKIRMLSTSKSSSLMDLFNEEKDVTRSVQLISGHTSNIIDVVKADAWGSFEVEVSNEIPENTIARVQLSGPMFLDDSLCSIGMKTMSNILNTLDTHPNISAVMMEADTGGGDGLAGQELMNATVSMKTPLVVYAHYLGSAGVEGTLGANEIIAVGKSSMIGSIGTLYSLDKEFFKWYAENFEDVYADGSNNKNDAFRQYLKDGTTDGFKKLANAHNEIFQKAVKKHRPLRGDIEDTLSGEMFLADKAKRRGLIDGIGNRAFAMSRLQSYIK